MDTRMERIRQDFENNQLGVDEPFDFRCTLCGKCCIHREDIFLTPNREAETPGFCAALPTSEGSKMFCA